MDEYENVKDRMMQQMKSRRWEEERCVWTEHMREAVTFSWINGMNAISFKSGREAPTE